MGISEVGISCGENVLCIEGIGIVYFGQIPQTKIPKNTQRLIFVVTY